MPNTYVPGWRTGDAGGAVDWSDSWITGQYAQQVKGAETHDAEYLKRFETLGKSDSSVDDEAGWRTVTNLRNNDPANIASIKQQAEEWKAKGFDVRVQDLDESHNAKWADLAVRKGQGKAAATPESGIEEGPVEHSDRQKEAKERVARWEDPEHPEYHNFSERIFGSDNEIANNSDTFNRSAEYDSERTEYDFSDDVFSNDSNQAAANVKSKTEADNLLNSYKNALIG